MRVGGGAKAWRPTGRANDLQAFLDFAAASLIGGREEHLTLDEALARWDRENESEVERAKTIQAVREGLDDMRAGRGRPFEAFDRGFRERRGLPFHR